MKKIIAIISFATLIIFSSGWAEIYKWVDEKGTVHFTEDPSTVPEKYKGKTEIRGMPGSSKTKEADDWKSFDPIDFIDNTQRYAGDVLKMKLTVGDSLPSGKSLQDAAGRVVNFYYYYRRGRLGIWILIPELINVPKAVYGDELMVTFMCREGNLKKGNVALSIDRL